MFAIAFGVAAQVPVWIMRGYDFLSEPGWRKRKEQDVRGVSQHDPKRALTLASPKSILLGA